MEKHTCDALLVCCIDFRFQKIIREWTDQNLKNKLFDLIGFTGSTKNLKTILEQVAISVKLHDAYRIILMHHEDCGAYGAKGTFEQHRKDLLRAKEKILEKHPKLSVETYYLKLNGAIEKVN